MCQYVVEKLCIRIRQLPIYLFHYTTVFSKEQICVTEYSEHRICKDKSRKEKTDRKRIQSVVNEILQAI